METDNIYHDGVVLILQTSCWGVRKKLPQDRINVSADPKFVSGTKRLVDHERYLSPIRRNRQQAAERVRDRWAVPGFPLTGASFIPKVNIETVESALQEHLRRHEELVEEFLPLYPRMKEEARLELGPDGLYDEEEYPQDVRSRFGFTWKYVILEAPEAGANVMTAPMLEREKQKIGVMIDEFRANPVTILRTEFARAVANLADCLKSGNKRRIRQESLDSLEDWIERFQRLNINDDRELAGFVETMRGLVAGTDARELRNNDLFRRTISNQMAEISVNTCRPRGRDPPEAPQQALMRTQTRYTTAVTVQRPRSMARMLSKVLEEARLAGESFYYYWEVEDRQKDRKVPVEGPSIDLAMSLARNYENCAVDADVAETPTHYIFKGVFIDLETGFTYTRLFRQRKSQKLSSRMDGERQEDIVFQIGQSKTQRNAITRAMPGWVVDKAIETAKQAVLSGINPETIHQARLKVLDFFSRYGGRPGPDRAGTGPPHRTVDGLGHRGSARHGHGAEGGEGFSCGDLPGPAAGFNGSSGRP